MLRIIAQVIAAALLSGCADLFFFKSDLQSPKTGVSVDIKQRMLLMNEKPDGNNAWRRMCAEPSPDALTSLGASLGASVLRPAGSTTQIGGSIGESSAFVGLRTQSIQLMRDAMYRACEAYMSGAIDEEDYLFLQRRFQAQVVGLLAIEQLTGAIAAQPVAVHMNASAQAGGGANEEADRLAQARKSLAEQKVKRDAAVADRDKAKAEAAAAQEKADKFEDKEDAKLTDEEKKLRADAESKKEAMKRAESQLALDTQLVEIYADAAASAEEDFKLAKARVRTAVSGGASVPLAISSRPVSEASMKEVSDSVVKIVETVFNGAFDDEFSRCMRRLYKVRDKQEMLRICTVLAKKGEKAALDDKVNLLGANLAATVEMAGQLDVRPTPRPKPRAKPADKKSEISQQEFDAQSQSKSEADRRRAELEKAVEQRAQVARELSELLKSAAAAGAAGSAASQPAPSASAAQPAQPPASAASAPAPGASR